MGSRKNSLAPLPEKKFIINTKSCGAIHVWVQGDLSQQEKRAVFLTVHDLGCNHYSFHDFVNHPAMCEIRERSVFIHVDAPGHEDNAPTLPEDFQYPSLQEFGEELVTVLDYLEVKYVIGFGEGAGANVLARFALENQTRLLGLILINCTGSAASVMDTFKNKYFSWSGKQQVGQSTEDFLIYHRYGHKLFADTSPDKEAIIEEFREKLHGQLNPHNVKQYVSAFLSRRDLSLKGLKVDTLLITGLLSPYASVVDKLYQDTNKEKTTLLKVERAGYVLDDAPAKVAQSLLLFCKGQGLLSSVCMPGIDRRMSRGMSMEEYDRPNIRRLSLTTS